jgi:fructokinase
VHGTLLSEIDRLDLVGQQLSELNESQLTDMLLLASRVAGVNCTRAGCQPPTREEVAEIFG